MSFLGRLLGRKAHRVRDEAVKVFRAAIAGPGGRALVELVSIDRAVEAAIKYAARKLGIGLSDDDARWVKAQIDGVALMRAAEELGDKAQALLDDIERWKAEGKL